MNDKTVRLVFIGSGDFSIPVFRSLFALTKTDSSFAITGIVTQPDRPAGRGRVLTPSPLRKALSEDPATNGIPVLTPKKLAAEADEVLSQFAPDLIVTVDYGQIVPFALLTKPKYRCLNIPPLAPADPERGDTHPVCHTERLQGNRGHDSDHGRSPRRRGHSGAKNRRH